MSQILPYTDTDAGTLVANGVADFGITGAIGVFTQRAAGADIKSVYAIVQTETGRVIFNDGRKDIQRPKDLDGKTYGGFGSAWENALISAIIRNDGGEGKINTVTLGTSAYEALANGSVDFTLEVYTWEGIEAQLEKKALRRFRYADYGVPDEQTTLIASSDAYIAENPEDGQGFHPGDQARLRLFRRPSRRIRRSVDRGRQWCAHQHRSRQGIPEGADRRPLPQDNRRQKRRHRSRQDAGTR